jgi:hypothetical protein
MEEANNPASFRIHARKIGALVKVALLTRES